MNWADKDKRFLWHPFTQMQEYCGDPALVIERGEGSWLIDTEGRRYLDGVASLWVNIHGHNHPHLNAALKNQLDRIAHSTMLGLGNTAAIDYAERLLRVVPRNLTRVFYSDDGSTAVEAALKIAFEYWQNLGQKKKTRFLSFANGYHGDTLGAVSVGQIELFHEVYRPLLFDAVQAPPPHLPGCLERVEAILKKEADTIAACVIEPLIQCAGGMLVQPPGFLRELATLCRRHDVLLILDEVATGFGRTGTLFACEREDVQPDILCLAKGMTGGTLPLAATLTTETIYEAFLGEYSEFKAFFHGHSYTGNPLGCAAAIATLEIFEQEKSLEKLPAKIRQLETGLQKFRDLPDIKEIRHCGLMAGIEIARPLETRVGHKITLEARRRGLITRPLGNTLVVMPPLSVTEQELGQVLTILFESAMKTLC